MTGAPLAPAGDQEHDMTHPGQPGTPPLPTGGPRSGPQVPPARPGAQSSGGQRPGTELFGSPQPGAPAGGWGHPGPGTVAGQHPAPGSGPAPDQGFPPGQGSPPGPGTPLPSAPAVRNGKARLGGAIGAVVVAGGVAAVAFGGLGDPEVGHCVQPVGISFETVACDDPEAELRIVGVVDAEMSEAEFDADPDPCADFPSAVSALWQQEAAGTDGTVYCAEAI
ncbi:hypothetical protein JOD57_004191 [Geodermatophilus bullaregiensis]|uniref:LppU/SCO3897 family protein n=1 Tax=Geodermatophilus bullaregiensis TaxID=1564160 RepID=UPI00195B3DA6|nr:hypothetical protein [Geodermatophilus bullaregiensis]MBM7808354.1 hypothetical protein [Geodermatophilus bullaregiensis]